jgi:hypothetical protein
VKRSWFRRARTLLGLGVADPVGCPKGIPHDVSYVAGDPRALDDSEAAAWQATGEELLERL